MNDFVNDPMARKLSMLEPLVDAAEVSRRALASKAGRPNPAQKLTAALRPLPKLRLLIGAALVAAIVLPLSVAVAQGWLPNVIPVLRGPVDRIEGVVTRRVPLTNVGSDEELQRLVSFPLWVPTDVPCPGPNQRWYDPSSRRAGLVYQCVAVSEQSADVVHRPVAHPGTLEEVVINGHPGYYYETTVVEPGSGRAETTPALVFEGEGTLVTLSPLPWHTRNGVVMPVRGKEDLVRIAESMKRVVSR